VCKSLAFTILFILFYVVEELIVGAFTGKTIQESIPHIGGSPMGLLYVTIILSITLIPFFAFREIGRVVGEQRMREMLLQDTIPSANGVQLRPGSMAVIATASLDTDGYYLTVTAAG
jgi:hypothetical protein